MATERGITDTGIEKKFKEEEKKYETEYKKIENKVKIILDEQAFSPNFIPKKIYHRDEEIEKLLSYYFPTTKGKWCGDISIYGLTGTGKTLIVTLIFNYLAKKTTNTDYVFIDCNETKTPSTVYQSILAQLAIKYPNKMGLSYYIRVIKKTIANRLLVLIFDEIDLLLSRDKTYEEVIEIFADWNNCVQIFVSNDPDWHRLITDHRTISRLHLTNMIFNSYTKKQIFDILLDRANHTLIKNSFDNKLIDTIADFSAKTEGDARLAIRLLYLSAKHAEKFQREKIISYEFEEAIKTFEEDNKMNFIERLPPQLKALLVCIYCCNREFKVPSFDNVYKFYENSVRHSKIFKKLAPITIRKYIKQLETHKLIVKKIGKGRGRNKGREPTHIYPNFDMELFKKRILDIPKELIDFEEKQTKLLGD